MWHYLDVTCSREEYLASDVEAICLQLHEQLVIMMVMMISHKLMPRNYHLSFANSDDDDDDG